MGSVRSLQVKFVVLVVTLLVVGSLAPAWISTRHERRALEAEIEKRGEMLARSLAGMAEERLRDDDERTLARLVERAGGESAVAAARLVGRDGSVRASLDPAELGRRVELVAGEQPHSGAARAVERRDRRVVVAVPIHRGGVHAGEAQVALDLAALVDSVVRDGGQRLALATAAMLLLGLVAGLVFVAFLVEPLRRLRAGVERLTAGDLAVRVPPTSRDEVGQLTQAFNAMGEALEQKERIQRAFGRYVSDYALEQLLRSRDGRELTGAEREVTILFVDVRRFTRLSEGMDARDVVAVLNDVFQLVSDRILSGQGTIDKFIGDSVMAYFGAPMLQRDHPERAVRAAVEIQRALAERNERPCNEARGPDPVEVGIGIHTGTVVVGTIGSQRRADYTAVGDAVNVASRLEELARPGEILVSEAVQRRVRGAFRLRFEGERQLSGRLEPVHVYAVERADPTTTPGEPVRS